MSLISTEPLSFGTRYRRLLVAVVFAGALIQLGLGSFYLGVGHSPSPRDLPVGLVGPSAQTEALTTHLQADGSFTATTFPDRRALTEAIRTREVAGGLDVTAAGVVAVTAGAGGALPAGTIKTLAAEINQQQGLPQTLPDDVVALSTDDINGSSLGYILQVISLGGSIASLGLGRLMPRVPRSVRRGVGHVGALVAYAVVSALIVLLFSSFFGIGGSADTITLFWTYLLVSLAITGSTAGFVTLFGPVGSLAGGVYFLIGATISGASIPWTFLPGFWAGLGEWLPTGGGAQLIRNTLYFPSADSTAAWVCLGLYAGLGALVVLIWNIRRNRTDAASAVDVDVLYPISHEHHRL
ncbi:ABC transporter permease [Gordonia sp. NPDC003376]